MSNRIRLTIAGTASLALLTGLVYWVWLPNRRSGESIPVGLQNNGAASMLDRDRTGGFSHKPIESCKNCHESDSPDETRARKLAQKVPELCFRCHEDESKTHPHVHGPVAVGQCLFCHDSHQSEHAHLLRQNPIELCALCHTRPDLGSIIDHLKASHANCLECHHSHASTERFLLKQDKVNAFPGKTTQE